MPACGVWLQFRAAHQWPYQAFAIAEGASEAVVIISEPPPSLAREQMTDALRALFGQDLLELHAYRWPTGVDGWLEDLVARVRISNPARISVMPGASFEPWQAPADIVDRLRFLHRVMYRTSEGMWIDRITRGGERPPPVTELKVPISDIAGWLAAPNKSWQSSTASSAPKSIRELYDTAPPGVFHTQSGLVALIVPGGVKLADVQADFRRFAVVSDLVLGAVGLKSNGLLLLGRQRQIPLGVLPPLRFENLQTFARNQTEHVAQSYERQRIFAGRVTAGKYAGWDWAPILLSPQLDDSEFGTLLNLADQILKSWSQHGEVEYFAFGYRQPETYPFGRFAASEYFGSKFLTTSLRFNWNTENVATITTVNGRDILTGDRTGALSILYQPSNSLAQRSGAFNAAEAQRDANARAADARDYFATRGEPILVRVVQNVLMYQAVQSFLHVADAQEPPRSSRSDQVVGVLQKYAAAWLSDVLRRGAGVDPQLVSSVTAFMNTSGFTSEKMAMVLASPQSVERELERAYQKLRRSESDAAWMPGFLGTESAQSHELFVSTCASVGGQIVKDLSGRNKCQWKETLFSQGESPFASYQAYSAGLDKMLSDYLTLRTRLQEQRKQFIALEETYERAAEIAAQLSRRATGMNLDAVLHDILQATAASDTRSSLRSPSVVLSKNTFDVEAIGGHNIDLTPARRLIAPTVPGLEASPTSTVLSASRLAPPRPEAEALSLRRTGSLLEEMRSVAAKVEARPERWTEVQAKAKLCQCDAIVMQGEDGVVYFVRNSPPAVQQAIYGKSGVIDALAGPPPVSVVRFENFAPGTVEDIARSTSLASFGSGGDLEGGWNPIARLFRGSEPTERSTVISITRAGKLPETLRISEEVGAPLLKESVAWRTSLVEPATRAQWAELYGAASKLDPASDAVIVHFGTAQAPRGTLGIRVQMPAARRPGVVARLKALIDGWKISRPARPSPWGEGLLDLRDAIRRQLKPLELEFYCTRNKSRMRVAEVRPDTTAVTVSVAD